MPIHCSAFFVIWNYCQEPTGKAEQEDKGDVEKASTAPEADEDPAARQKELEAEAKKALVGLPGCGWGHF